ncbi:MAG: Lrp/AsnC family transcriptional regulator [Gordonia sp. (in: high G+C Gram-positive bacteria)]
MTALDSLDTRLLLALDDNPDITTLALAQQLGVARNTVHARLRRLTEAGVIGGFGRRIDPAALGYRLVAFVSLSISQIRGARAMTGIEAIPEVVEAYAITGDSDFLLKVVARDTADLHRITNAIVTIEGVNRSSTAVALEETLPMRSRQLLDISLRPDH